MVKDVEDQDELDDLEQELQDEWAQESVKLKDGLTGLKEKFKDGVDNNEVIKMTKGKIKDSLSKNNSAVLVYMQKKYPNFLEDLFE